MNCTRRSLFAVVGAGVISLSVHTDAANAAEPAASFPSRPIRIVVPYPPGGPTDIAARIVSQRLSELLKQPVLIDNKSGGGGNIGASEVTRAAADGYTLLLATTQHAINMSLVKNMTYDVRKNLTPVSLISEGPLILVTGEQQPFRSLKDVIDAAKDGKVTFASAGNGGSVHLAGELLNDMAHVKMLHIPYRGSAPALSDVMSGQVTVMIDSMLSSMPFIASGKLRAIAVTSSTRSKVMPNVPTLAESGLPGFEVIAWNGVLAPAGTPPQVISRLNGALTAALQSPDIKDRFAALGFIPKSATPAAFGAFIDDEVVKWARVVKSANVTTD